MPATNSSQKILEGIFFIRTETSIEEDWCPICRTVTRFLDPVKVTVDRIEKRKLNCGHEMTYIFLVEQINGELKKVVRRRIC